MCEAERSVNYCSICRTNEFETELIEGTTQIGRDFYVCKKCIKYYNLKTVNDVGAIIVKKQIESSEDFLSTLRRELKVYKSENRPLLARRVK